MKVYLSSDIIHKLKLEREVFFIHNSHIFSRRNTCTRLYLNAVLYVNTIELEK